MITVERVVQHLRGNARGEVSIMHVALQSLVDVSIPLSSIHTDTKITRHIYAWSLGAPVYMVESIAPGHCINPTMNSTKTTTATFLGCQT